MGAEAQVWDIAVTPRERWALTMLFLSPEIKLRSALDKGRHRRARAALGVARIVEVLRATKDCVRSAKTIDDTPELFTVTVENADYILNLIDIIETSGEQAVTLDELGERLRAAKDGTGEADPSLHHWDALTDGGWEPEPAPEEAPGPVICPSCKQSFDPAELKPPPGAPQAEA